MIVTAVTIFSITYAGIAFGRIPGLMVDRTGIALLGLAVSSNIGSAATIIGNPQNMLIGQVGNLSFGRFFFWCAPPALVSLLLSYLLICRMYHTAFHIHTANPVHSEKKTVWPELNRWQSIKGLTAVSILVVLFFTAIPREIAAIAIAGLLLCSRKMHSREIMIVIEQAKRYGVHITFRNHAQVGIPVTLLSLLIVIGWVYL